MNKRMTIPCSWCGELVQRYPSTLGKNTFCSSTCKGKFSSKKFNPDGYFHHPHLSELNQELNPDRMCHETCSKLRKARLGTGSGKSYSKFFGRHLHRIVAEIKLGRRLLPGEVVHHGDQNKRNSSPQNLEIFQSQKEHAALHAKKNSGDAK